MDEQPSKCPICGNAVPISTGAGRPRRYCTPACSLVADKSRRIHPWELHDFQPAPNGVGSICRHCECAPRSKVGRLPKCPCR